MEKRARSSPGTALYADPTTTTDGTGKLLARLRINDDADGFAQLAGLLAGHGDNEKAPIPVAVETSRGLLVACLRATGRQVFAINPFAAARYWHSAARRSPAPRVPRPWRTFCESTWTPTVRCRRTPSWPRRRPQYSTGPAGRGLRARPGPQNKFRYNCGSCPSSLAAFADKRDGLCSREARTILAAAPAPTAAAKLTRGGSSPSSGQPALWYRSRGRPAP